MDYNTRLRQAGPAFTQAEIEGRNMWMVWTGGNDRLWDRLTVDSIGTFDLLKTISSHPRLWAIGRRQPLVTIWGWSTSRASAKATGPDPKRFGSVARRARSEVSAGSVRDERSIPASKIGARGKTVAVGSYYGEPTGIVGLRLFPNPDFDEKARRAVGLRALLQRSRLLLRSASSCGRIASACPAPSATSARTRSGRPRILRIRSGRTSARTSARSTSGGIACSTGAATRTRTTSSTRRCTSRGPARSTPRSSRPTTSTTRAR